MRSKNKIDISKTSKEYLVLKRGIENIKRLRDLEEKLGSVLFQFDTELNQKRFSFGSIESDQLEVLN